MFNSVPSKSDSSLFATLNLGTEDTTNLIALLILARAMDVAVIAVPFTSTTSLLTPGVDWALTLFVAVLTKPT